MTVCFRTRRAYNHTLRVPALSRYVVLAFFSSLAILAASCASIQPPPGGPEEKTPPAIDTTIPKDRSINVPTDTRLYFRFDRPVDRSSFQSAFSITPYVNGIVKYHWSGYDEVTVELPERLRDSTTYTVQLSRDLKSRRNNPLQTPLRITFSTGPAIDTGSLSGFVLTPFTGIPMKASEIYVYAYDITVRRSDTLHFTLTPPDLLTQPNDQGIWQFLAMKVGHTYRVLAVTDVYRNHVYDPGVDAYAVPASDAIMDSVSKAHFFLRMSHAIDTTRPDLQDVEVTDSLHLAARFSEAIDTSAAHAQYFSITGSGGTVPIIAAWRESEKRPGQINLLAGARLTPGQNYKLSVVGDSIRDLAGNTVTDSTRTLAFSAPTDLRALTSVRFAGTSITDSVGGISLLPRIAFNFSEAVDRTVLAAGLTLTDTAGKIVPSTLHFLDDAHVELVSRDTLAANIVYTITLQTRSIQSPSPSMPRNLQDTTLHFHFRTMNPRDNGILGGVIAIADSFFTKYPQSRLVVQLLNTTTNELRQAVLPHGDTTYSFTNVPVAGYRLRAYLAFNESNRYDPGSVEPWRFGAPTGDFPGGEVQSRARWEIRNIRIEVR